MKHSNIRPDVRILKRMEA